MPSRRPHVTRSAAQGELARSLTELQASLDFPADFSPAALAEAVASAERVASDGPGPGIRDRRDIDFCTIDPAGSRDLDQAVSIAADGDGYLVHYAIADVPAFVRPGGEVDAAARTRGQTVYAADGRIPLYPETLSEGSASLLPEEDRHAFVWSFETDAGGRVGTTRLERAIVRSRRQWSYPEAQAAIDDGSAPETVRLLAPFGAARQQLESERGGASLNTPDEEIVLGDDGYRIERRVQLPVEAWNAHVSLMTGMAAAQIMLEGKVGVLRTMPPADPDSVSAFRAQTVALGRPWPEDERYGDYLRGLDGNDPAALAVMQAAASLFRGAGYTCFDGVLPRETGQAAIGAPYAHVTAPLRRLVDRWGLAICEALASGREAPGWARDSLDTLPAIMAESGRRISALESGSIDRVEAALLAGRVGDAFDAIVLSRGKASARIQLADPVVTATVEGSDARPGQAVRVRLTAADIGTGKVAFAPVPGS